MIFGRSSSGRFLIIYFYLCAVLQLFRFFNLFQVLIFVYNNKYIQNTRDGGVLTEFRI